MDWTELMKASHPLERSFKQLATYSIEPCTENTFSNRDYLSLQTSWFFIVIIELSPSIPLHWVVTLQTRDIQPRACMSNKLSAVEKVVEEVLIDLMTERVLFEREMSMGVQASSTRGVQSSLSTARRSKPSQPRKEKRNKHRDQTSKMWS